MSRFLLLLSGALAMALPTPVLARGDARLISIRICGDPSARSVIPMNKQQDEPSSPCDKACHIGGCRRRT